MPAAIPSRAPRWYAIPVRMGLVTFIAMLLCFAVDLLLAIMGLSLLPRCVECIRYARCLSAYRAAGRDGLREHHSGPAMVMEIRHYRQTKTLSAIERLS